MLIVMNKHIMLIVIMSSVVAPNELYIILPINVWISWQADREMAEDSNLPSLQKLSLQLSYLGGQKHLSQKQASKIGQEQKRSKSPSSFNYSKITHS